MNKCADCYEIGVIRNSESPRLVDLCAFHRAVTPEASETLARLNASEALHLFTSDEAGNCTVCGATKRWQYHVDEEAMRNDVLEEAAQAIECHVPSSVHALQQEMANVVRRMKTD